MWREPSVHYTPQEDIIIIECVEEAIAENRFLVEGFDKAAKLIRSKIGNKRSTGGIKNRWYNTVRKSLKPQKSPKPKESHKTHFNTAGKSIYSRQEDEIIIECVVEAVLRDNSTLTAGIKKAIDRIQKECGITRCFGGVAGRWYKLLDHLPEKLQKEYKAVRDELAKTKLRKDLSAGDIIDIAEKMSRNPMHVLGVLGNIQKLDDDFTAGCALQLAKMKRQIQAQEKLIQTLSKQLASSNRYRNMFINLKYNDGNAFEIVNALMRAPHILSLLEQRRLVTVLRVGWPELFDFEKGGGLYAKPN
jgi:NADH dehydrogenase/NADH:ubiquinone oxidoreductase subunit G